MELKRAQLEAIKRVEKMGIKKQKPLEILAATTEELGEVATEVSLFEKVGNKVKWERRADKDMLAREISQLLVNIFNLASIYKIDVDKSFRDLLQSK